MGPNQVLDKGLVPSVAAPIYSVVNQSDVEEYALPAAGGDWVGVLQEEIEADDVTVGRHARVRVLGMSYVRASGALALRDRVVANADGTVSTAAPGAGVTVEVVGKVVTPAADGEWAIVQLMPGAQVTG